MLTGAATCRYTCVVQSIHNGYQIWLVSHWINKHPCLTLAGTSSPSNRLVTPSVGRFKREVGTKSRTISGNSGKWEFSGDSPMKIREVQKKVSKDKYQIHRCLLIPQPASVETGNAIRFPYVIGVSELESITVEFNLILPRSSLSTTIWKVFSQKISYYGCLHLG